MVKKLSLTLLALLLLCHPAAAQYNTDRLVMIGHSALFYEDYVLSMQYFNQAIQSKPYLYEPWFFRGVAKYYLEDYAGSERDCTEALERNEPSMITRFAVNLAQAFNRFYYECRILDDDMGLRAARLQLTAVVKNLIKTALYLIGVDAPERM